MPRYDIRRRVTENDTTIGGITLTSTSIETRFVDLQNLRGEEVQALGGLRIEANYKGYVHEEADIREGDLITPDSGLTNYQVVFIDTLFLDHTKFFAKKVD